MKKLILLAVTALCMVSSMFANCPAVDDGQTKMPPFASTTLGQ